MTSADMAGGQMASLRDQLLKAGVVSKKAARQSAHSQCVEQRESGKSGQAAHEEAAARRAAMEAQVEAERARVREEQVARAEAERAAREAAAEAVRVARLARSEALARAAATKKAREAARAAAIEVLNPRLKTYFVKRDGGIAVLATSSFVQTGLVRGELAIAEADSREGVTFVVIRADLAVSLRALDPEVVRFFNEGGGEDEV